MQEDKMKLSEKVTRIANDIEKNADAKSRALSVLQEMQNAVRGVTEKYSLGIAQKMIQDKLQEIFGPQIENLLQKQDAYRTQQHGVYRAAE